MKPVVCSIVAAAFLAGAIGRNAQAQNAPAFRPVVASASPALIDNSAKRQAVRESFRELRMEALGDKAKELRNERRALRQERRAARIERRAGR